MTTLLHISDMHFGTEQAPVVAALEALALAKKPDVLIVSGDITQRATPAQFAQAKAFCDRLQAAHMLAVPGNHDIPLLNLLARLVNPYGAYCNAFGDEIERHVQTPLLHITTVNTTRRWRHKNGDVSKAQIDRVCQHLSKATAQQLRVVVVHQPVHVLRLEDEHDRLRGWQPAVREWAQAGADIVMGGHIHLPYVCELSTSVPGLARRMWCVQAGTAVSSRIRREAPNSVNVINFSAANTVNTPRCSIERWDYQRAQGNSPSQSPGEPRTNAQEGQFVLTHTSELNLQRD